MTLKKKLLKKSGLYLILDKATLKGKDIIPILSYSLKAGVDIVQFRDNLSTDREFLNTAIKIKNLLKERDVLFIVNDRLDIALALDSDGIHLGQDDLPVETVRNILGRNKVIGISTHSICQIREAITKDIDYMSIGPIFSTLTKPDYKEVGIGLIKKAKKEVTMPFVAIGGINKSNIDDVVRAGAKRIAVVNAVLSANDPFTATKELMEKIKTRGLL